MITMSSHRARLCLFSLTLGLRRVSVPYGRELLGDVRLLLQEVTGGFRNFHVLELGERLGDGREGFLDGVQHGFGFGGHWGSLNPQGLIYGFTPYVLARD